MIDTDKKYFWFSERNNDNAHLWLKNDISMPLDLVPGILRLLDGKSLGRMSCLNKLCNRLVKKHNLDVALKINEVLRGNAMELLETTFDDGEKDMMIRSIAITHFYSNPKLALEYINKISQPLIRVSGMCEVSTFFEKKEAIVILQEAKELVQAMLENSSDDRVYPAIRIAEVLAQIDSRLPLELIDEIFADEHALARTITLCILLKYTDYKELREHLSKEINFIINDDKSCLKKDMVFSKIARALAPVDITFAMIVANYFPNEEQQIRVNCKFGRIFSKKDPFYGKELLSLVDKIGKNCRNEKIKGKMNKLRCRIDPESAFEKACLSKDLELLFECAAFLPEKRNEILEKAMEIFELCKDNKNCFLCTLGMAPYNLRLALKLAEEFNNPYDNAYTLFIISYENSLREGSLELASNSFDAFKMMEHHAISKKIELIYLVSKYVLIEYLKRSGKKMSGFTRKT